MTDHLEKSTALVGGAEAVPCGKDPWESFQSWSRMETSTGAEKPSKCSSVHLTDACSSNGIHALICALEGTKPAAASALPLHCIAERLGQSVQAWPPRAGAGDGEGWWLGGVPHNGSRAWIWVGQLGELDRK